jgi:hypothetical protein
MRLPSWLHKARKQRVVGQNHVTSARPNRGGVLDPVEDPSFIFRPGDFTRCCPDHRTASTTLILPHPLGRPRR